MLYYFASYLRTPVYYILQKQYYNKHEKILYTVSGMYGRSVSLQTKRPEGTVRAGGAG